MIVLIPYINLLNLSWLIKCLFLRNMEPFRDHFRPRPCANDAIYFPLPQRNFCSAPNWRTENFDAAKENHRCARKRLDTFFGSVRFDSEASIPVSCANRFYWFIVAETSNRYPLYSRYSSQLSKWLPVRSNKNSMASSSDWWEKH